MAAPPDFTQENLNTLNAAIAAQVRRVRFADREQEYSSMSEMIAARNLIKDYLDGQSGTSRRRTLRVYGGSGW